MPRTYEPILKPVRIVDESVLNWARSLWNCEVCGEHQRTYPHHIKSRGAGGSDTMGNIVACCWFCHEKIHRGLIGREVLRGIVEGRS